MPRSDFYNHNRFIAYPLQEQPQSSFQFGAVVLPESALADAGFVLGIDAGYDPLYRVKLIRIVRAALDITLVFQDEAATATFEVTFALTAANGTIAEVDATEGPGFGSGFAVAGDLGVWGTSVPPGSYDASESFYVEQGCIQSLYRHYVKQFTIASQPDTPWHLPAECGGAPADIWQYVVTGRDLRGHRKFKPGYNATISVIELDNAIEIGAGIGAGEGEPCERVPLGSQTSMESLSSMSSLSQSLSSMSHELSPTRCKDVFNTINGVWPNTLGEFTLSALSSGLTIETFPDEHRIVVEFRSGAYSPYCTEDENGSSSLSL